MPRYRAALRDVVTSESKAYGFTLVTWGTGAIAASTRGGPGAADVIAYVLGALASMTIVILVSFGGPASSIRSPELHRVAWGAVHLGSVAGAIAVGWAMTELVEPKALSYLAAGGAATLVYQIVLGFEVAMSEDLAPHDDSPAGPTTG